MTTVSKAFGVSPLTKHESGAASPFARKGREKTAATSFARGQVLHVPLIADALAQIECLTSQILPSDDHAIVVGLVEAHAGQAGEPLLYYGGHDGPFVPLPA